MNAQFAGENREKQQKEDLVHKIPCNILKHWAMLEWRESLVCLCSHFFLLEKFQQVPFHSISEQKPPLQLHVFSLQANQPKCDVLA